MDTFIQEEFILQTFVLIIAGLFLLQIMLCELFQRRKEIDEITKYKLKKIYSVAYKHFFNGNKEETKKQSVKYIKDVYNKKLVNEKYDLIKGV